MTAPEQEQANALCAKFDTSVARLRNDTSLSLEGKRASMAKEYVATSDQLRALADQKTGGAKAKLEALERKVFGLPVNSPTTDIVSFRDAIDRVSAIDPTDGAARQKLTAVLESSELSGDSILARAVLSRAFQTGDTDLINEYVESYPAAEADIVELWNLRNSRRNSFVADWIFVLTKPAELSGLSDIAIAAYAQGTPVTA